MTKVIAKMALIMYILYLTHAWFSSEKVRTMRREALAVRIAAKFLSESTEDGLAIYPRTGDVVTGDGASIACSLTGSHYVWKFPRNSNNPVLLTSRSMDQGYFYACSDQATSDGRRVFVFTAPLYAMILKDSDVDWTTHQLRAFVVPKPL